MKYVFALFVILGVAFAIPVKEFEVNSKTAVMARNITTNFEAMDENARISMINEFIDIMLTELQHIMMEASLDPMQLPDVHKGFSFRPIIITYHGDLDLYNGWANDISKISRGGNVVLDYSNRVLKIDVPLQFQNILFDYLYSVKLMDLGPWGGVDGKVKDVNLRFVLQFDFKNLYITLDKFDITKIGSISVKFTGHILFDWLLNILVGLITTIFKGLISFIVEIIIRNNLVELVNTINNSLEEFRSTTVSGLYSAGPF